MKKENWNLQDTLSNSVNQKGATHRQKAEKQFIKKEVMKAIPQTEAGISLVTGIEITKEEHMKQKLQNSEARYRRLFESAKDGILILDAESGEIIDANPYLINRIGYSIGELLGKELWR